jgi:hypothetical protein
LILEHGGFPNFYKIDKKCIAMHHSKKFFIALQGLFAATQQKHQKPPFLIKNRGLRG